MSYSKRTLMRVADEATPRWIHPTSWNALRYLLNL
jgi:hypothetical protein